MSRWAEGHAPATRLAFAQAAALARPGDPRLALSTARLARDAADSARAETWFRRAVKLARGKDWEAYVRAFLGLGIMYHRGGNYPAAGVVVGRALRAARRRRLRALQGEAHHELFVIALGGHRTATAYSHATAALEAYGPDHPRVPHLAHDLGVCWFDTGRFDLALSAFEHLQPCFVNPGERARVLANIARAAAGAGARQRYEEARAASVRLLAEAPDAASVEAEVLVIVAHGDNSMREWRRAEAAARHAAELAAAQGAGQMRLLAEAQLECARAGGALAVAQAHAEPLARNAERLARVLTSSLTRRTSAGMAAAV
jgi:tetratricopeptide (TPR) repeat protein